MSFDITGDNYLAKLKIDLTEEFGEGAYVELREPSKKEFLKLFTASKDNDEEKIEGVFSALLPALIVSHGFTDAGKPATNERVADALGRKIAAINKIEQEYIQWASSPFLNKKESKSNH